MPATKNAPLYQQIYDEIKDAIEKGVYAPKERIPSEDVYKRQVYRKSFSMA